MSGFHCEIDEICAPVGYYAGYSGNSLPEFWDSPLVPSSRVRSPLSHKNADLMCCLGFVCPLSLCRMTKLK